ncbi:MAG: o-succinylbenzoate synthase [Planctomycetota bacterium]
MKLSILELRHLKLPLVNFFETSFGRVYDHETVLVILHTRPDRVGDREGFIGYGEAPASAFPYYSSETVETCWYILKNFLTPLLTRKFTDSQGQMDNLNILLSSFSRIRGHQMAKAAVEFALSDLQAQAKGYSLSHLYGGTKKTIPAGISLGIDISLTQLMRQINTAIQTGYQRIKIKIKPGWDIITIKEIRSVFPDIALSVDANGAYTSDDWKLFKELDKYKLLMIEQPLAYNDLMDHAALQKKIKTPICLDESITSFHAAEQALALKSCRIINIKPARVGGPSEAKKIHDLCLQKKIPVWCGGLLETGIGRLHNIAIASLPGFKLPNDISASERYYQEDIITPPVSVEKNGFIKVPEEPGLAKRVDLGRVEKYTIKKEIIML